MHAVTRIAFLAVFVSALAPSATPADDAKPGSVAWSPEHIALAFTSFRGGSPDIWFLAAGAKNAVNLTPTDAMEDAAEWSPEGTRIVFCRTEYNEPTKLWVMNADGSGVKQLAPSMWGTIAKTWTPDGKSILFQSSTDEAGEVVLGDLVFLIDADGSNLRRAFAKPVQMSFPWCFTPDGTELVFYRYRATPERADKQGGMETRAVKLATLEERLIFDDSIFSRLAFSADGQWIAFSRESTHSIEIVRTDGTGGRVIVSKGKNTPSCWSPDGKWVLYETSDNEADFQLSEDTLDQVKSRLWAANIESGEIVMVHQGMPGDRWRRVRP